LRESPNIFMPIAVLANQQIVQWVYEGKISHQRAQDVTLATLEAFPNDEE
jgi:hypothetical protein